jgi:hypothetical protein
MNSRQISRLVTSEIGRIVQTDLVQVIQELLVEPREDPRDWDYGKPGERFSCWVVIEHPQTNTAIVYCEQGFGPTDPWGSLVGPHASMGMDACWFVSLEDAVRGSPFWHGKNPDGYEVQ